jgi:dATP pyrophosphohydrolase
MRRDIQVECIVFRWNGSEYEFLLLKRIPEKGGFWQPVSGGVEDDEPLLVTAFRELKEEADLSTSDFLAVIPDVHYFEFDQHYLTGEPIPIVKEYVFGVEVSLDAIVSIAKNPEPEHEEFKWVPFEQALELLKWENNKDGLRKLQDILSAAKKG